MISLFDQGHLLAGQTDQCVIPLAESLGIMEIMDAMRPVWARAIQEKENDQEGKERRHCITRAYI